MSSMGIWVEATYYDLWTSVIYKFLIYIHNLQILIYLHNLQIYRFSTFVDDNKLAIKVTRLYFMLFICNFITSKTIVLPEMDP